MGYKYYLKIKKVRMFFQLFSFCDKITAPPPQTHTMQPLLPHPKSPGYYHQDHGTRHTFDTNHHYALVFPGVIGFI